MKGKIKEWIRRKYSFLDPHRLHIKVQVRGRTAHRTSLAYIMALQELKNGKPFPLKIDLPGGGFVQLHHGDLDYKEE